MTVPIGTIGIMNGGRGGAKQCKQSSVQEKSCSQATRKMFARRDGRSPSIQPSASAASVRGIGGLRSGRVHPLEPEPAPQPVYQQPRRGRPGVDKGHVPGERLPPPRQDGPVSPPLPSATKSFSRSIPGFFRRSSARSRWALVVAWAVTFHPTKKRYSRGFITSRRLGNPKFRPLPCFSELGREVLDDTVVADLVFSQYIDETMRQESAAKLWRPVVAMSI